MKWIKRILIGLLIIATAIFIGFAYWVYDFWQGVGEDVKRREQYYKDMGVNPDSPMGFSEDGHLIQLDSNDIKKMKGKEYKDSVKNNDKKPLK